MDIKQNALQQIFKISKLSLDSGTTTTSMKSEIDITTTKSLIREIHETILNKKELSLEKESKYKLKLSNKFLYIFFNWYFEMIIISSFQLIIFFLLDFIFGWSKLLILSKTLFIISVGYFFLQVIKYLISHHKFRIKVNEKSLYLSYGLFTKVHNTVPLSKVKAVIVEEGLLKRLFKLCTIKIEVIGIAEADNSNINVIVPLCRRNNANKYIKELIDESYIIEKPLYKSNKHFKYYFFNYFYLSLLGNVYLSFNIFGFSSIFKYSKIYSLWFFLIMLLLSILYILLTGKLKQKNQGLYFDKSKIVIHNSTFNKTATVIQYRNIIAIELKHTKRRIKDNVCSYAIHYYNHNFISKITVELLEDNIQDKLREYIKK